MKIVRTITKIILGGAFFLLTSISAYAGFGVSPTNVNEQYLSPGTSFTQEVTLSRSGDLDEMNIIIEPTLGEMDSWFKYEPAKIFKFESGESTKTVTFVVNVPENAQYKNYTGVIRITTTSNDLESGGVSITQGLRLDVDLTVTKEERRALSILSIKALDSVDGKPIRIEIIAKNPGNVDASPSIKIRVMNLLMEVIEEAELANFGFVKPNNTETLIAEFTSKLPSGEYFIEVSALLDGSELRTERLVFHITNTPTEAQNDNAETTLISQIGTFFRNNRTYSIILLVGVFSALTVEIAIYKIFGKKWKYNKPQMAQIPTLAESKYIRAAFSFAIGFIILLVIALYPLIKETPLPTSSEKILGTQDSEEDKPQLYVLPEVSHIEYLIYEKPDINSYILYTAKEGEQFQVVEEQDDWFKVLLSNNQYGWLQKSIVKSEIKEEK